MGPLTQLLTPATTRKKVELYYQVGDCFLLLFLCTAAFFAAFWGFTNKNTKRTEKRDETKLRFLTTIAARLARPLHSATSVG